MKRYCILENDYIDKIELYSWNYGDENKLIDIYKKMINSFLNPLSNVEILDSFNSESYYTKANDYIRRIIEGERQKYEFKTLHTIYGEEILLKFDLDEEATISNSEQDNRQQFLSRMKNSDQSLYYGELNRVIKEIYSDGVYFYLDLCQSLYFSIKWLHNDDQNMVYLDPFEDDLFNNDFLEKWEKFQKKGSNEKQAKRKKGIERSDKDVARNGKIRMLSSIVESVPLDTKIEFHYKNGTKIPNVGADIIRFFIDTNNLVVFNNDNEYGLHYYEKINIENILSRYEPYSSSDNIENYYLMEECFHMNISTAIYDFLERLLYIDKLTDDELKEYLAKDIEELVAEIRKCKPIYLKWSLLKVLSKYIEKFPIKEWKINVGTINSSIILQNKRILKFACIYVKEIVKQINEYYVEFSNCLLFAAYRICDNDIEKCKDLLQNEILCIKDKLDISELDAYQRVQYDKKNYDKLFPHIQRALIHNI